MKKIHAMVYGEGITLCKRKPTSVFRFVAEFTRAKATTTCRNCLKKMQHRTTYELVK